MSVRGEIYGVCRRGMGAKSQPTLKLKQPDVVLSLSPHKPRRLPNGWRSSPPPFVDEGSTMTARNCKGVKSIVQTVQKRLPVNAASRHVERFSEWRVLEWCRWPAH
jgi:hypothetical protein